MRARRKGRKNEGKGEVLQKRRSERGQAIVESAFALMFITGIALSMLSLLSATGLILYYKIKVADVADAVAQRATLNRYWMGALRQDFNPSRNASQAASYGQELLKAAGFARGGNVRIDQRNTNYVVAVITVDNLPILGSLHLPRAVSITERAVRLYEIDDPVGVIGLAFSERTGAGKGFASPVYGRGVNMKRGGVTSLKPGPQSYPTNPYRIWAVSSVPSGRIVRQK